MSSENYEEVFTERGHDICTIEMFIYKWYDEIILQLFIRKQIVMLSELKLKL